MILTRDFGQMFPQPYARKGSTLRKNLLAPRDPPGFFPESVEEHKKIPSLVAEREVRHF